MSFEHDLLARMSDLENRLASADAERAIRKRRERRYRLLLGLACGAFLLFVGGRALSDPGSPLACTEGTDLFCFDATTPAKANEVNHNFAQVKKWTEDKVGLVNTVGVQADSVTVENGSAGDISASGDITAGGDITASGNLRSNRGFVGQGGHGPSYAHFSHRDLTTSGNYALLQQSDGTSYVNASSGRDLYLRIGNSSMVTLNTSGMRLHQGFMHLPYGGEPSSGVTDINATDTYRWVDASCGDSDDRGKLVVKHISGQDSLCLCGYWESNFNWFCINP